MYIVWLCHYGNNNILWVVSMCMVAWYEARNMSSFRWWVRVKQQTLLDCIWGFFTVMKLVTQTETGHLTKPEGITGTTYQMHNSKKQLLLHCIPHAQRDFPHSPDHNFLLCWDLSCSDHSHIVSVLIDIHQHLHPQTIHTVSFTLYGEIRLSPHYSSLLRWCLYKFVLRAFHFQNHKYCRQLKSCTFTSYSLIPQLCCYGATSELFFTSRMVWHHCI